MVSTLYFEIVVKKPHIHARYAEFTASIAIRGTRERNPAAFN